MTRCALASSGMIARHIWLVCVKEDDRIALAGSQIVQRHAVHLGVAAFKWLVPEPRRQLRAPLCLRLRFALKADQPPFDKGKLSHRFYDRPSRLRTREIGVIIFVWQKRILA